MTLHWHQGSISPNLWTRARIPKWGDGVLFMGEQGDVAVRLWQAPAVAGERIQGLRAPEPFIPKSLGHHAEWIHACKTGDPTTCNFEYAGWLTEANHLGNVAYRAGKKLEWDAAKLYAPNAPEAEPFIRRDYRKGWSLT